jgi:hypothetical protein
MTFDFDQTGAPGPPSQLIDDVEMLDVVRIGPKIDPPPPGRIVKRTRQSEKIKSGLEQKS